MNENSRKLLFPEEIPHDLFVSERSIQVYDVEKNASTGDEVSFPYPYNVAVGGNWAVTAKVRLERYLCQKFQDEGYIVRIPEFRGERFSLLVEKGGKRILLILALESEDEAAVWRSAELQRAYSIVVIRDCEMKEPSGATSITVDQALGSFNFLSV